MNVQFIVGMVYTHTHTLIHTHIHTCIGMRVKERETENVKRMGTGMTECGFFTSIISTKNIFLNY